MLCKCERRPLESLWARGKMVHTKTPSQISSVVGTVYEIHGAKYEMKTPRRRGRGVSVVASAAAAAVTFQSAPRALARGEITLSFQGSRSYRRWRGRGQRGGLGVHAVDQALNGGIRRGGDGVGGCQGQCRGAHGAGQIGQGGIECALSDHYRIFQFFKFFAKLAHFLA